MQTAKQHRLTDTYIRRYTLTSRRVKAKRVNHSTYESINDWIRAYTHGGWIDGGKLAAKAAVKTIGGDIIVNNKRVAHGDWIVIDNGVVVVKTNNKFNEEYYQLHQLPQEYLNNKINKHEEGKKW